MKFLRFFASEGLLGALVAALSIMTALATFQNASANSEQNRYEILGMKSLNEGNAEYMRSIQVVLYDYQLIDSYYTADSQQDADYFAYSFSPTLKDALARDPNNPFAQEYFDAIYSNATALLTDADANFEQANRWDAHSDRLQVVMLFTALGLTFAAWASLLRSESAMRVLFSLLSILLLCLGVGSYLLTLLAGWFAR
ncbi:MAG: hypothetical protein HFACDABA_02691 [Anaerolineales bacterium]|nr:hypothetical protein [Anaerolineales bacterium]